MLITFIKRINTVRRLTSVKILIVEGEYRKEEKEALIPHQLNESDQNANYFAKESFLSQNKI